MKKLAWVFAGALFPLAAMAADAPGPDWAFMTPDPNAPAPTAAAAPAATAAQPGVPSVVATGKGNAVQPCSSCHLPSGLGQPESANLAGQNADYLIRQMADFKSGARGGPLSGGGLIARALTDQEIEEIAKYYAGLTPVPWTRIVESDTAPKTVIDRDRHRNKLPGNDMEPLGKRIVEFAGDPAAIGQMAQPAFVAYVPPGSLAAGKGLVEGSKTEACDGCHGDNLTGSDDIPRLAGRSPVYIGRQLYSFKNALRKGGYADVMKDIASGLNDDDIIAVASYVASLNPS